MENSSRGQREVIQPRFNCSTSAIGMLYTASPGHEIDVTDLVHAAQIRVVDFQLYDDPLRIELEPAFIVERHLGHHEIARETLRSHHSPLWALERLAADEQLAVGKLHDRMQH